MDGQVTLGEFVNYYTNLGAHIDNDDYFEVLVNVWRKPATEVTPSFAGQNGGVGVDGYSNHPNTHGASSQVHYNNDEGDEEGEEVENHEPLGQGRGQQPQSSAFSDSMRVWRDGQGLGSQFVGGRGMASGHPGIPIYSY